MSNATLPLEEITKILTESILSEHILDKEKLPLKIKSLLKVWIKVRDVPNNFDTPKTKQRQENTDVGKLKYAQAVKDIEALYWREKLRILIGEEQMKVYYNELDLIKKSI